MAGFIDDVLFTPVSSGTGDFVVSSAVQGYMTPAQAGAANGTVYCYRAESADLSQWEVGFGAYTVSGTTLARSTVLYNSLGTTAKISFTAAPQVGIVALSKDLSLPKGQLWGLTLSAAGSSSTFSIAAGEAVDSTAIDKMALAAFTKTTAAWAVGTGNGSLDAGSNSGVIQANTWYWVFIIKRPDTGVVDILTTKATAGVAPVPSTLPTNYTLYRYIGSVMTDSGSQYRAFTQVGDEFHWAANAVDINSVAMSATATSVTLTVPLGVNVVALFHASYGATATGGQGLLFSSLDENDVACWSLGSNNFNASLSAQTSQYAVGDFAKRTNTSAQIRTRASTLAGAPTYSIYTYGWIDTRGRQN